MLRSLIWYCGYIFRKVWCLRKCTRYAITSQLVSKFRVKKRCSLLLYMSIFVTEKYKEINIHVFRVCAYIYVTIYMYKCIYKIYIYVQLVFMNISIHFLLFIYFLINEILVRNDIDNYIFFVAQLPFERQDHELNLVNEKNLAWKRHYNYTMAKTTTSWKSDENRDQTWECVLFLFL